MLDNTATLPKRLDRPSSKQHPSGSDAQRRRKQGTSRDCVEKMIFELADAVDSAVSRIHEVNSATKVLALNARIEAARAGQYGAPFSVVASEMQALAEQTTTVANSMAGATNATIDRMLDLIGSHIRGTRLSDLARTNIDLVDRNLYERTCDVRWWATDSSLTDALMSNNDQKAEHASRRMGIILDAYTVYHDLVLCTPAGQVIANGRPSQFRSKGKTVRSAHWFSEAMSTRTGNEFGFQSAHPSELAGGHPALIYSCSVRRNGIAEEEVIGVLGVIFKWADLAQPILNRLPLTDEELAVTEAMFITKGGEILASSNESSIGLRLGLTDLDKVFATEKGHFNTNYQGRHVCVAHAKSPGFETYSTGWYSLIIQDA
jgi:hypothetical protein